MHIYTAHEAAQLIAKHLRKPVIYISFRHLDSHIEVTKAAPYLAAGEHYQVLSDGTGIIVCEDEAEQERLYESTVGDDGPTKLNSYNGPARVFALTINDLGELQNENT